MKYTIFAVAAVLLTVFCQAQGDTANETVIKDDEWEADGANWTADAEDTREGGGNRGDNSVIPFDGEALVENKLEVFEGREAALSLGAQNGLGGSARGNARGDQEDGKIRNLVKTLRGNHQ